MAGWYKNEGVWHDVYWDVCCFLYLRLRIHSFRGPTHSRLITSRRLLIVLKNEIKMSSSFLMMIQAADGEEITPQWDAVVPLGDFKDICTYKITQNTKQSLKNKVERWDFKVRVIRQQRPCISFKNHKEPSELNIHIQTILVLSLFVIPMQTLVTQNILESTPTTMRLMVSQVDTNYILFERKSKDKENLVNFILLSHFLMTLSGSENVNRSRCKSSYLWKSLLFKTE